MGTEQSSPANGLSKEEQEVISSMQVIGERGRSIEQKKRNTKTSNESLEDTTFIEVDQFGESMTDTESESEYSSSDESEIEDSGEDADRELVLEDARKLKKLAMVFLHPEVNVSSTSPTAFGRNYFSRPSAIEQDDDERAQILADAAALKKLAIDYAHPEVNVSSTSPTAFGRNYFSRPSAIEQEGINDAEERAQILADATAFKKLAIDYSHPENVVSTSDGASFGRNYFNMLSMRNALPLSNVIPSSQERNALRTKKVDKQQVLSKLNPSKDSIHKKLSEIDTCNVKRSPSSVILFGLGDDDGSAY